MTSETMALVMTHSGLQIESRIPDEEIPESIVFQDVEYTRVRYTTFSRKITNLTCGISHEYFVCDECGSDVGTKKPSYCPKCGHKGVSADD